MTTQNQGPHLQEMSLLELEAEWSTQRGHNPGTSADSLSWPIHCPSEEK